MNLTSLGLLLRTSLFHPGLRSTFNMIRGHGAAFSEAGGLRLARGRLARRFGLVTHSAACQQSGRQTCWTLVVGSRSTFEPPRFPHADVGLNPRPPVLTARPLTSLQKSMEYRSNGP